MVYDLLQAWTFLDLTATDKDSRKCKDRGSKQNISEGAWQDGCAGLED